MAKWFIAAKKADFEENGRRFGISPVLARLIRNRDLVEKEEIDKYLNGTAKDLYDPFLLKGMARAVELLAQKIAAGAAIRIIGDYDVDGICAVYILWRGITESGGQADTVIPHRIKDGFGLNDSLITAAAAAGIDTMVTCDNGIAAAPQIAAGKALGMTVIVTDHHEVPFTETDDGGRISHLPPADAVVDPWQEGCPYPFKQICGGVVAVKVIEALFMRLERIIPERLREELYCLAAVATVCDVMELRDENRLLVKYALPRLRECANVGIRALIDVNGITERHLSPYHLGFIIGPCLNATGRLDTAQRATALLRAPDYREACRLAAELKELNESRKEMTLKGVAEATALVEAAALAGAAAMSETSSTAAETAVAAMETTVVATETTVAATDGTGRAADKVLVLYLPDCHESLAGIIAGRIRERFGRPTFILTDGEEAVKGSGRSIPAYHMFDEMSKCKELFIKYGGHKMAAGLSLRKANIEEFRRRLNQHTTLTAADFEETVHIDIALPLSWVTRELIAELDKLEPFGAGNPRPLFARTRIGLRRGRILGKTGQVGKFTVADESGQSYEMIYFGDVEAFNRFLAAKYSAGRVEQLYGGEGSAAEGSAGVRSEGERSADGRGMGGRVADMEISVAYYPEINHYQGRDSIQIVMKHYC